MRSLGIKEIRKALGMTAEQLGKEVGISASYILRIESGNVQNPSFATISKLAEVIASTEDVKNGKVNLNEFDSDFGKLVLSFRYSEIKDAYDFVRNNNNIEEYSQMVKYLSEDDMNTITSLIEYRKVQHGFIEARKKLKNAIIRYSKNKNYEEAVCNINFKLLLDESLDLDYEIQELLLNEGKLNIDLCSKILLSMSEDIEHYGIDNFEKYDNQYSKDDLVIDEKDDKEYEYDESKIEEEENLHSPRRGKMI
ncbi:transcriptional regulator with XRE-family HTH domain [Clostridium pascui]|uniref:helix-turn-helix domain-containing protein n=1 Tax=Clostridium pascui TaxID=46609 RepID=UPI00195C71E3|nr:helix-turn-helix transcriptional regulator [Clostridium pascui]MBM7872249.1 transcriptional regulator with XRE-family HTH domain [Clostridium pascui]